MKAIFVSYNQAYNEEVIEVLNGLGQRGYTLWEDVHGQGGFNGQPRLGSHAWPEENHAVLAMVKDEKVESILSELRKRDEAAPELGLRAFVWNIENAL